MGWNSIKRCTADIEFSRFIRIRDKWRCVRCGRQHEEGATTLGCSHYWGRRNESTRFDPENCDALCNMPCHRLWGGEGRADYTAFKKGQLGPKRYRALEKRSNTYAKKDRKAALKTARELLASLQG